MTNLQLVMRFCLPDLREEYGKDHYQHQAATRRVPAWM